MKNKNSKLFIGAVVLIGAGAYLIYRFATKNKSISNKETDLNNLDKNNEISEIVSPTQTRPELSISLPIDLFPLKKGQTSNSVVNLKIWLNQNDYARPKLDEDGVFGTKTENAVIFLQTNPRLKVLSDYFNATAFSGNPIKRGEITQDFYEIFVTKTKNIQNSTLIKKTKNPLSL